MLASLTMVCFYHVSACARTQTDLGFPFVCVHQTGCINCQTSFLLVQPSIILVFLILTGVTKFRW